VERGFVPRDLLSLLAICVLFLAASFGSDRDMSVLPSSESSQVLYLVGVRQLHLSLNCFSYDNQAALIFSILEAALLFTPRCPLFQLQVPLIEMSPVRCLLF